MDYFTRQDQLDELDELRKTSTGETKIMNTQNQTNSQSNSTNNNSTKETTMNFQSKLKEIAAQQKQQQNSTVSAASVLETYDEFKKLRGIHTTSSSVMSEALAFSILAEKALIPGMVPIFFNSNKTIAEVTGVTIAAVPIAIENGELVSASKSEWQASVAASDINNHGLPLFASYGGDDNFGTRVDSQVSSFFTEEGKLDDRLIVKEGYRGTKTAKTNEVKSFIRLSPDNNFSQMEAMRNELVNSGMTGVGMLVIVGFHTNVYFSKGMLNTTLHSFLAYWAPVSSSRKSVFETIPDALVRVRTKGSNTSSVENIATAMNFKVEINKTVDESPLEIDEKEEAQQKEMREFYAAQVAKREAEAAKPKQTLKQQMETLVEKAQAVQKETPKPVVVASEEIAIDVDSMDLMECTTPVVLNFDEPNLEVKTTSVSSSSSLEEMGINVDSMDLMECTTPVVLNFDELSTEIKPVVVASNEEIAIDVNSMDLMECTTPVVLNFDEPNLEPSLEAVLPSKYDWSNLDEPEATDEIGNDEEKEIKPVVASVKEEAMKGIKIGSTGSTNSSSNDNKEAEQPVEKKGFNSKLNKKTGCKTPRRITEPRFI